MNKQAAEKLATDYYTLGLQLALHQGGLVKEAGRTKEIVKKLIQAPTAGLGYVTGGLGILELLNQLPKGIIDKESRMLWPVILGTAGAGGMAAAHLSGKGVDKAHKLLSKLRK
jgi:hypothetical protein